MKHVTIPTATLGGAKKLTHDQRNLLIILEDVSLRFAGAETFTLSRLPELKINRLARSYCTDVQEIIRRRMMEIRRCWGGDRAEGYEDRLEETFAACKPELERLRHEIRAALVQKVRYQDIDRAMHIATASGLVDCCARCHEWITGNPDKRIKPTGPTLHLQLFSFPYPHDQKRKEHGKTDRMTWSQELIICGHYQNTR